MSKYGLERYRSPLRKRSDPIAIESDWVSRIRSGDEVAFQKLFMRYCQPLINFARRYVQDTPTAENLVQDVFLKIWANRARLNPALSIKTYLYTAVKNQALRQLRHSDVEHRSIENLMALTAPAKTPEDEWDEKEIAESVHQAIAELPEKCRIIFSMNRFDNLTYAEIAKVLNLSIKTVETQMGRALKFLRKRLIQFI